MCKADNRLFADYKRLNVTKDFLDELSRSMGIPIDLLIKKITTGDNEYLDFKENINYTVKEVFHNSLVNPNPLGDITTKT